MKDALALLQMVAVVLAAVVLLYGLGLPVVYAVFALADAVGFFAGQGAQ